MNQEITKLAGFTCAYTPLPLLAAAGFTPYRILPVGQAPDQAGSILHDNMCPHVKRVLDRALDDDLPGLDALVVINSCDAMRRLADAWPKARPAEPVMLLDLPYSADERAVNFLRQELLALAEKLAAGSGRLPSQEELHQSIATYNRLARLFDRLDARAAAGTLTGGRAGLQRWHQRSVTEPIDKILAELETFAADNDHPDKAAAGAPILLFGNVLAETEAFDLFEEAGARIVAEDLCTGSRQLTVLPENPAEDPYLILARGLLNRPPCARTIHAEPTGDLAEQVMRRAQETGARGVVAHVLKFCDPYLARLPAVHERLRKEGMPLLVLEGDCTMRSLGQQRTRIEAFVEMLQGEES